MATHTFIPQKYLADPSVIPPADAVCLHCSYCNRNFVVPAEEMTDALRNALGCDAPDCVAKIEKDLADAALKAKTNDKTKSEIDKALGK